jgi:membrane protein
MQKIYSDNQLGIFAGNATLFIITAVFPLLMLVISVVGMLPGYTPDDVTDLLFQFLPDLSSIRSLVNNMVSNLQSQSTGLLASVAAITTLWSASAGTTAVQAGLQKIAQVPKKGVRDKLVSLLFTLLYVILIPALLILQVMQESILNLLTTVTAQIGIEDVVEKVASIMKVSNVVAVIGAIVILALTYACLPGKKRALKDQIPGTIFMGVLFVLFTKLFGFFIPRFYHSSGIYGSLASLFLALLWLRFAIMILFYGGALNEALIAQKEKQKE